MAPTATLVPASGVLADDVAGGHVGAEGLGGRAHEAGLGEGLLGLVGGTGQVGHGHGLDAQADAGR